MKREISEGGRDRKLVECRMSHVQRSLEIGKYQIVMRKALTALNEKSTIR